MVYTVVYVDKEVNINMVVMTRLAAELKSWFFCLRGCFSFVIVICDLLLDVWIGLCESKLKIVAPRKKNMNLNCKKKTHYTIS